MGFEFHLLPAEFVFLLVSGSNSPREVCVFASVSRNVRSALFRKDFFAYGMGRSRLAVEKSPLCFPNHSQCACDNWLSYLKHLRLRHEASMSLLAWFLMTTSIDADNSDRMLKKPLLWAFPLEEFHNIACGSYDVSKAVKDNHKHQKEYHTEHVSVIFSVRHP